MNPYTYPLLNRDIYPSQESVDKCLQLIYSTTIDETNMKTRKQRILQARQVRQVLYRLALKKSLQTTAIECGRKDHATVIHSIKTVKRLCESDPDYRRRFTTLLTTLGMELTELFPDYKPIVK